MGKPTGFIEHDRAGADKRPVAERTHDFRELVLPLHPEHARQQAGRCMDCGVPVCHQGCPLGNVIPDFNELVYRDRWQQAYEVLASTNDFPELTGRLCPAPCEASCVLAIDPRPGPRSDAHMPRELTGAAHAVTIELIEKTIIERAFEEGWVVARPPARRSGKRVAVVGSGPAGLAAAAQLNRAGHEATIFERADRLGGLVRYGIPDFKLEKQILDRRLAVLAEEGVRWRTSVDVGVTPSWRALRDEHDAIVLAIGASRARQLEVPGVDSRGVILAMDYLEAQNRAANGPSAIDALGKRVLILGGGDTGSDCLGTAHRQGARSVSQIELLPAPPGARASTNPWPQWPLVFRTSTSQEEGGTRLFGRRTTHLEASNGALTALHLVEVTLQDGKLVDVPGSDRRVEVDLLILALGFVGPDTTSLVEQLGLRTDARGNIQVDAQRRTSVAGVYCAGDASRGASLIVWAISDGREAAREVDLFLRGSSQLATRGVDRPFSGR